MAPAPELPIRRRAAPRRRTSDLSDAVELRIIEAITQVRNDFEQIVRQQVTEIHLRLDGHAVDGNAHPTIAMTVQDRGDLRSVRDGQQRLEGALAGLRLILVVIGGIAAIAAIAGAAGLLQRAAPSAPAAPAQIIYVQAPATPVPSHTP